MLPIILALLGGALLSIQIGVNNTLRAALSAPIWAAFISFFVGSCALLVAGIVSHSPIPTRVDVPIWAWIGGLLGAVYVVLSVVLADKIGIATLTGCVVAGQISASVVIDHFGWLRTPHHALSPGRMAGVVLLGLGVWLVKRF